MSVTVKSILAMILENNLQMDDIIEFAITDETEEGPNGEAFDVDFVRVDTYETNSVNGKKKKLIMWFDLNSIGGE